MNKMDFQPLNTGDKLRIGIQFGRHFTPVIPGRPIRTLSIYYYKHPPRWVPKFFFKFSFNPALSVFIHYISAGWVVTPMRDPN